MADTVEMHLAESEIVGPSKKIERQRVLGLARSGLLHLGIPLILNVVAAPAFAQAAGGDTDPNTILQAVLTVITGDIGTSLAALGIIACGLAWMFGRASLGLITGVVGGIMIVFGSVYVAGKLVGTGT